MNIYVDFMLCTCVNKRIIIKRIIIIWRCNEIVNLTTAHLQVSSGF